MRETIFTFVMLISICCYSQETCEKMTVSNDDVTEKTTISSEKFEFADFSLTIIAGTRSGSYPKIIFKIKDECVDEYQPIYLVFNNDKK